VNGPDAIVRIRAASRSSTTQNFWSAARKIVSVVHIRHERQAGCRFRWSGSA